MTTKVFTSRKPEPYIKSNCKKCITPLEYYPDGQIVGQNVSVKCWACDQVETYIVTEATTTSNTNNKNTSGSKPKTTRKKGSDDKPISMEYYELLGISHTANGDEIKKAYRKMAIKYHPDKNQNDPSAEEKFKKLSEAYQVLSDPKLRKRYNELGEENGIKPDGGFGKTIRASKQWVAKPASEIADPEDFFKQSFGGDRFLDIIGEISIGRDMRDALETAEEDEHELTPKEKAAKEVQKMESEQERNLVRIKRVEILSEKLIAKLNRYNPNAEQEFVHFIKKEAEDLKQENHGVELLHAIGYAYNMKVNYYSSKKFAFGLGGFYTSMREKGYIFSQTVGTLRTAYDLQSTFGELQKAEENGITEEEKAKLEEAAAIKGLQAIWRGSKLEIESVIRDVCDEVLSDAKCSKEDFSNRIRALGIIANIYQCVVPDPSAEAAGEQTVPNQ